MDLMHLAIWHTGVITAHDLKLEKKLDNRRIVTIPYILSFTTRHKWLEQSRTGVIARIDELSKQKRNTEKRLLRRWDSFSLSPPF